MRQSRRTRVRARALLSVALLTATCAAACVSPPPAPNPTTTTTTVEVCPPGTTDPGDDPGEPADVVEISLGAADWGFKESWRNYIDNHGETTLLGDAGRNEDGMFRFRVESGTHDTTSGVTEVRFSGGVHFRAHCELSGSCAIDIQMADLRVVLDGDGGEVHAVLTGTNSVATEEHIGNIDLTGIEPLVEGDETIWNDLPVTLTERGATIFQYAPGEVVDSLSFSYGADVDPAPETWTPAGSEGYSSIASVPNVSGVGLAVGKDTVFHISETQRNRNRQVIVYDRETLAPLGETPVFTSSSTLTTITADPESDTAFVRDAPADGRTPGVHVVTWNGETVDHTLIADTELVTDLVWDAARDRVVAIGASGLGVNSVANLTLIERDAESPTGWSATNHSGVLPTGQRPGGVQVMADGTITVATHSDTVFTIEFGETGPTSTAVVDGTGYRFLTPGPDGGVYAFTVRNGHGERALINKDETGVVSAGPAEVLAPAWLFTQGSLVGRPTFDADTGRYFYLNPTATHINFIDLDGAQGSSPLPPAMAGGPAMAIEEDGQLYVVAQPTLFAQHTGLHLLGVTSVSPTVLSITQEIAVHLDECATPVTVMIEADVEGHPQPELRWQTRAPGRAHWSDVDGATGLSLEATLGASDDGRSFRIIATNSGGVIASDATTVEVTGG